MNEQLLQLLMAAVQGQTGQPNQAINPNYKYIEGVGLVAVEKQQTKETPKAENSLEGLMAILSGLNQPKAEETTSVSFSDYIKSNKPVDETLTMKRQIEILTKELNQAKEREATQRLEESFKQEAYKAGFNGDLLLNIVGTTDRIKVDTVTGALDVKDAIEYASGILGDAAKVKANSNQAFGSLLAPGTGFSVPTNNEPASVTDILGTIPSSLGGTLNK